MTCTRILAIAPYEGLKKLLLTVASEREDVQLDAYVGDLENGVTIARALEHSGYDVILTRGGTSSLIRRVVSLPVIDLSPSIFDVLRFIYLAQSYHGKFAVVGFSNITDSVEKLFKLMRQKVDVFTINDSDSAALCLKRLKKDGYSLIIGDAIATTTAEAMQMTSMVIASGKESIREAIDRAVQLHHALAERDAQNNILRYVFETDGVSVLAFDKNKQICYANNTPDQLDHPKVFDRLGNYVQNVLENGELSLMRTTRQFVWQINGVRTSWMNEPCAAFTVRKKPIVFTPQSGILRYYNMLNNNAENDNTLFETVGRMSGVLETVRCYTQQRKQPVYLQAENGLPVESVVKLIFQQNASQVHIIMTIDAALLDIKSFRWLLENENSPLAELDVNLCLKNLPVLCAQWQQEYIQYVQNTLLHKRNHVVYIVSPDADPASPIINYFTLSDCIRLCIPSLRERKEDILSICMVFIGKLNVELGKHIVGIVPEAQALLEAYHWPGNHEQLYRVLKQLLLTADTDTIDASHVLDTLTNEPQQPSSGTTPSDFLQGTLYDINCRIVQNVLKEEDGNRTRTAKRLNIGRSTLWRMLDSIEQNTAS